MTTITCYGGVNEIGGNKILVEDGERRLLFDFGKSFGRYGSYFDGVFIRERAARGVLDPLALGLIPPLRGLLREDLTPVVRHGHLSVHTLEPTGRQRKAREVVEVSPRAEEALWEFARRRSPHMYRDLRREHAPAVDLVLLSHAHQDHIADLEYVAAEVPACSSLLTAFISKVLVDVGQAGLSGAPYINPKAPSAQGMLQPEKDQPYRPRPWRFLDGEIEEADGGRLLDSVGSFWAGVPATKGMQERAGPSAGVWKVQHWPVDHSLLGAIGCAVETEAGWVAYTGDLRFHGQHAQRSWAFADGLAGLRPSVLLCEGTRLGEPNQTTEAQVEENCLRAVRQAQGRLVVADFAPRNVERLMQFARIAAEAGRQLLIQPKDAYLLRAMHLADDSIPDVEQDPHIGLYADPKARVLGWEKEARERYAGSTVGPEEAAAHPGESILAFSLTDLADMIDLQFLLGGNAEGLYLFSNSRAYDDEQKVDLVRLWNWTQHLGLQLIGLKPVRWDARRAVIEVGIEPGYHASGHAGADELAEFVRRVRPGRLVPIHTEQPEAWTTLLAGTGIEIVPPEPGRPITIGRG